MTDVSTTCAVVKLNLLLKWLLGSNLSQKYLYSNNHTEATEIYLQGLIRLNVLISTKLTDFLGFQVIFQLLFLPVKIKMRPSTVEPRRKANKGWIQG